MSTTEHLAERECGFRQGGGLYVSVPMAAGGVPAEHFLVCEPRVVDLAALGVSPIGTRLLQDRSGVFHLFDFIGETNYPNVADFIEETRRYGLSRRIARTTDFALITDQSRILLIHPRAFIRNSDQYHAARPSDECWCPKDIPAHLHPDYSGSCLSLAYENIREGTIPAHSDEGTQASLVYGKRLVYDQPGMHMHRRRHEERAVLRKMKTFTYRGLTPPEGVEGRYQPAIFMSFPIRLIEVVRDREGGTHQEAVERAKRVKSGVEVRLVDE